MEEGWQKENIEKSKKVLIEHFERRKQERMFKEMYEAFRPRCTTFELHRGSDWDIDESDFDEFIWDIPIEKKSFLNKIKDVFSNFYYNLLLFLWSFKCKIIKK